MVLLGGAKEFKVKGESNISAKEVVGSKDNVQGTNNYKELLYNVLAYL